MPRHTGHPAPSGDWEAARAVGDLCLQGPPVYNHWEDRAHPRLRYYQHNSGSSPSQPGSSHSLIQRGEAQGYPETYRQGGSASGHHQIKGFGNDLST